MIILIVILLVLLWFLINNKKKLPNITTTTINTINRPRKIYKKKEKKYIPYIPYIKYYDNRPVFRGLVHKYQTLDKDEYGGSKPFKYKKLDNTNLNNNKIKYYKYDSYRIKPITKKDLDK